MLQETDCRRGESEGLCTCAGLVNKDLGRVQAAAAAAAGPADSANCDANDKPAAPPLAVLYFLVQHIRDINVNR